MFTAVIARRLDERGHDVSAVVADRALLGLSDEQILIAAAADGRALVTANIKICSPRHRLPGHRTQPCRLGPGLHQGLPQDRSFLGATVESLTKLLAEPDLLGPTA